MVVATYIPLIRYFIVHCCLLLQKKAKKIKKGLMTRAAHKVKKTFKPKQVAMFVLSPTYHL